VSILKKLFYEQGQKPTTSKCYPAYKYFGAYETRDIFIVNKKFYKNQLTKQNI